VLALVERAREKAKCPHSKHKGKNQGGIIILMRFLAVDKGGHKISIG
jgi:hypothetical protein